MDALDKFISKKVGSNHYQYLALVLVSLINLFNGATVMLSSIVIPAIIEDFKLSIFQLGVLAFCYHIGMVTGSIFGAMLAKELGRAPIIKGALIAQIIGGFLCYYTTSFYLCSIFNVVYGMFGGVCITVLSIYINEIVAVDVRGRLTVLTTGSVTLGRLLGLLIAYMFTDLNKPGQWQLFFVMMSVMSMCFILFWVCLLLESLRYLWLQKKYGQFKLVLQKMVKINSFLSKSQSLTTEITEEEIEALALETESSSEQNQAKVSYKTLVDKKYLNFNIKIWLIWMGTFAAVNSQSVILPLKFGKEAKGVKEMALTVFGEVPAIIICSLLIDKVSYGRKKSIQAFTLLIIIFSSLCLGTDNNDIVTLLYMGCRMALKGTLLVLIPYTVESYPTNIRTMGMAVANALAALITCFVPFIAIPLFKWDPDSFNMLLSTLGLLSFIPSMLLKFDTTMQSLDKDFMAQEIPKRDELLID
jgi:MFS family permease